MQCKKYIPVSSELCLIGKLVLRGTRIVIPQVLRQQTLPLAHEGHIGIISMKQRLKSKVWWPGIDQETEKYCKTCNSCQLVSQPSPSEPLKPTTRPQGPWQHLAIDLLRHFPSGDSVLVVVDYFSRYYEVKIMKSTISENSRSLPLSVTSDNGPHFISDTSQWGNRKAESVPVGKIKIAQAENKNWEKELLTDLIAYRTTPHTTMGASPAELLFGRKLCCKMLSRGRREEGKAKKYAVAKRNAVESNEEIKYC